MRRSEPTSASSPISSGGSDKVQSIVADLRSGAITSGQALERARKIDGRSTSQASGRATKLIENALFKSRPKQKTRKNDLAAELGSAAKLRSGGKITSQSQFDAELSKAYRGIKAHQDRDLVPIVAARRALGDRVSKDQFDSYLRNSKFTAIGGAAEDSQFYRISQLVSGGITTSLGGSRFYIKPD